MIYDFSDDGARLLWLEFRGPGGEEELDMGKNPKVTRFDNRNIVFLDKDLRFEKENYSFGILLDLKKMTYQIYVRGKCCTIVWKIVAVMCKHLPSLDGNHLTAADIWSKRKRRQFLEQTAAKGGIGKY